VAASPGFFKVVARIYPPSDRQYRQYRISRINVCRSIPGFEDPWRSLHRLVSLVAFVASILFPVQTWCENPAANSAYRYAAGLFDMREYELAGQEFSAFILSFPEDSLAASAAYWLGESLFELGRYTEAADAFSRTIRPGADESLQEDARMRRAESLWTAGDPAGAAVAFEAVLRAYPVGKYRGTASYWLGRCYLELGRSADASRVLKNAAAWCEDTAMRAEAATLAGDTMRNRGNCEEAEEQLRAVLRISPIGEHAPAALEGLAQCALDERRWEDAADVLSRLTETFPNSPQATTGRYHLAESLSELGRHTEAMAAYRAVLRDTRAQEFWDKAIYGEAWAASQAGDTVAALASFSQLASEFAISPLAAEGKFREAHLSYEAGEYSRAKRAFGEIMSDWPTSAFVSQALYWRGWTYQKIDDAASAERDFLNYAATFPDSVYAPESLLMAGFAALQLGAPERAVEPLERIRQYYPTADVMPQALAALARANSALGLDDKANTIRSQLALDHPESEEAKAALLQKGYSDLERGRETAAIASLEAVIERRDVSDEERASAVYHLAEAYYRLGDYGEAESLYVWAEELLQGDALEDDAVYGQAWSALRAGDTEAAGSEFARLAERFPNSEYAPEAMLRDGKSLYDQGRYRESAAAYGRLYQRYGSSEYSDDALYAEAWCSVQLGDLTGASALFRRLVELFPGSELVPDALYDLGSCYTRLARDSATARTLMQLLREYPEYPRANEATAALAEALDNLGRTAQRDSVLLSLDQDLEGEDLAARALLGLAAKRLESDPQGARELLRRIVTQHPNSPEAGEARIQLGWLLFQDGRVDEAHDMVFPLCDDTDSELAGRACMRAAEATYELGNLEQAADYYARALSTNATAVNRDAAWYGLAWCNMELDRVDEAINAFTTLYTEHRDSPLWTDGSYRLGQLLLRKGSKEEAASVFETLGDVDEAGSLGLEATYKRALLLREQKAYSQAASLLRKVAKGTNASLSERALFELGRTLSYQNRLTEATRAFLELADTYPTSDLAQQAVYSAGVCQNSMKRWEQAAELFARASDMPGEMRPGALIGEGAARAELGQHAEASLVLQRLLQDFPDYVRGPEVSFRLAQSLLQLGDFAKVDSICQGLVIRTDWQYPDRALWVLGSARERMEDEEGAIEAFQQLVENYPQSNLVPYARAHLDALAREE
jgi:TolA-binding protein